MIPEEEVIEELEADPNDLPEIEIKKKDREQSLHRTPGYVLENNIKQVINKEPRNWKIQLKTGEISLATKKEAQKALTEDPDSSKRYL